MNFNLSEEQQMLKDSIEKFVQSEYSLEQRQAIVDASGFSQEHWNLFAELGWHSVPFGEENGGFGGDMGDVAVVMEEFGKGLVLEPYTEALVLFGRLLEECANEQQKAKILPRIIDGSSRGAVAYIEKQSRYYLSDVLTSAEAKDDGYCINGGKVAVPFADSADYFIVSARMSGEQTSEQGIGLFLVDAKNSGISCTQYRLMDGQRFSNLSFDNVVVDKYALLSSDKALDDLQQAVSDAALASCAEGLGICQKMQELTVAYCKERKQFGMPIGAFQVLQHRMVDMYIACEQLRSLLYRALISWSELNDLTQGQKNSSQLSDNHVQNLRALKIAMGRTGQAVANEAIQLHGGMGLTDEMSIGHYLKRLRMINAIYGDADFHQARFNQAAYTDFVA